MPKEDTFQNSELEYATKKVNEYPNHIPQYNCDDSYCTVLKHLYQTENFSPELINKHIDTTARFHSKITEPNFKEPQLSASKITCNNGQYTKDQDLRLHLLSILFNEAKTIYNMPLYNGTYKEMADQMSNPHTDSDIFPTGIPQRDFAFFAKQLITSDLTNNNIPFSLKPVLKNIGRIFQEEITLFQKYGLDYLRINNTKPKNWMQLEPQLNTIKKMIIGLYPINNNLPPFWTLNNKAIIEQDNNIFLPTPTNKKFPEFVIFYSYYLIIYNYIAMLNRNYSKNPLNDFKNTIYNQYKSNVQACYAFYLFEICPQYYELKEQVRTIRYHFAYKVFYETKSLLEPTMHLINNKVLLLEPYINTFLKVDYTRPESTAKKKKIGQHSTISEYYDTQKLIEKIKVMLWGALTNNNNETICIALPQKNNKRYIGSRNLAYVLGIPESKDFFDKILNDKPVNPKTKIPQKISDRWLQSINILSPTYDENNVPYNMLADNNLGFLLNNDELTDLTHCVKILKEKAGSFDNIIDEIKAIAKTEKNYITFFDITYFKLFYESFFANKFFLYIPPKPIFYNTGALWFTLPFIHISNVLSSVTEKLIKSPEICKMLSNKFKEIYENLGKSFASGKIVYSVTDIEKIKVDAIVTSTNKTPESVSPIAIKANGSKYHKYIIESFNPVNENGLIQKDLLELYYIRSLNSAMQNDCHSIAFPSYYFEKKSFESLTILKNWQHKHYGYYIDITICFQTQTDIKAMQTKMNNLFLGKTKLRETNIT